MIEETITKKPFASRSPPSNQEATAQFQFSPTAHLTDSETEITAQDASQPPPPNQQSILMSRRPPRRRSRDNITYVDDSDFRPEEDDSYQPDTVWFPS